MTFHPTDQPRQPSKAQVHGLTIMEMLVSISLLAVIILGLYAMFDMTQRAFMTGTRQVDIMEGGRAAMDLMVRDLAQASPCGVPSGVNFYSTNSPVPVMKPQEVLPD